MPYEASALVSAASSYTKTILFVNGRALHRTVSLSLRANGYRVIVTSTGEQAMRKALHFEGPIHMVLANLEMPDMTGPELAERIRQERPETQMFFVAEFGTGLLLLNNGWQFLPKPFAADMLKARIRDMLKDPPRPQKEWLPSEDGLTKKQNLTARETEVLRLIASGHSTKQIAHTLGIAFKTCGVHRTRLMKKLGIHDSVSLTRYAIRAGHSDAQ